MYLILEKRSAEYTSSIDKNWKKANLRNISVLQLLSNKKNNKNESLIRYKYIL